MENKNFYQMYDHDITKRIQDLAVESSKLKTEIFRSSMLAKNIERTKIHYYLSFINEFLKFWEEYGIDLQQKMKKAKGAEGVHTIKYNDVKDYIYANYDYAAVVRFTDNLIKGSQDGDAFNTNADIESVFKYGISEAFDDLADSTAGLLDAVVGNSFDTDYVTDMAEAKYFDSVKSYNKMIRSTDRMELYKSTKKIVDFLTDPIALKSNLKLKNTMLFVTAINHIVEFMTYSLTAYATRIYAISKYAYPFIHRTPVTASPSEKYGESVELPSSGNNDILQIRIMCDTDDGICRDPMQLKQLIKSFSDFTTMIGADSLFGSRKPSYGSYPYANEMEQNEFAKKLIANELYNYITKNHYTEINFQDAKGSDILELDQMLKHMIYNQQQAVQGTNTPKQEILHIIRGTDCEDNVKAYQQHAVDLMKLTFNICGNIHNIIRDLNYWRENYERNGNLTVNVRNALNEINKTLKEFYGDIASAAIMKARDIEYAYNRVNSVETDQLINKLKLNVGPTNNVVNAVPDTTRLPIDLINLYALPAFEAMQMYDEFVMNMPGFENDQYFREGVMSDTLNKIFAWIQSAHKKLNDFVNNGKVKKAVEWVTKNENELRGMIGSFKDEDKSPQCYQFKKDITLTGYNEMLINGLKNFNADVLASEDTMMKYVLSLYPGNGGQKSLFNPQLTKEDLNSKGLKQAYRNMILFSDDPINVKEVKEPPKVIYSGKDLGEHFEAWIDSVKGLDATFKGYESMNKQITDAFNKIKQDVVKITNEKSNDQGTPEAAKAGEIAGSPSDNNKIEANSKPLAIEDKSANTKVTEAVEQANGNNKEQSKSQMSDKCITMLGSLISTVWLPVSGFIAFAVFEEYKYLSAVYKAKNPNSNNNNQNS